MKYFCHLDSTFSISATNLQLYSLKKASEEWNDLVHYINENGSENLECYAERLVFITNCFGLSISQIIGQNYSSAENERIESPSNLFQVFLNDSKLDVSEKEKLNNLFSDFLIYYDALRHFGKAKYNTIDSLTLNKLDSFRKMTMRIWDIVISNFRQNEANEIEDFDSIGDVIIFENLKANG